MRTWLIKLTLAAPIGIAGCSTALNADEEATAIRLREEEKLARDVYRVLDAARATPVFGQIAASESQHMAAVLTVLEAAGIADPALPADGAFRDPELAALFPLLVSKGQASEVAACAVGVEIEELDLADILDRRAGVQDESLSLVLDNLADGSRRHLASFHGRLEALGGSYSARHLSQQAFDAELLAGQLLKGR